MRFYIDKLFELILNHGILTPILKMVEHRVKYRVWTKVLYRSSKHRAPCKSQEDGGAAANLAALMSGPCPSVLKGLMQTLCYCGLKVKLSLKGKQVAQSHVADSSFWWPAGQKVSYLCTPDFSAFPVIEMKWKIRGAEVMWQEVWCFPFQYPYSLLLLFLHF